MKPMQKNLQGFSLIEVIVAFSILVFISLSLSQAFPFSLSINKEASNNSIVSYLAQQQIEKLIGMPYSDVAIGTIETKHPIPENPNYQRQTQVIYVDSSLNPSVTDQGMKKITVTVYYGSISKNERSSSYLTLITQK